MARKTNGEKAAAPGGDDRTWLKRELDKRHLSERKFARLVGCSAAHMNYMARGDKRPGAELALRMADELTRSGEKVTEQDLLREFGKLSPLPEEYDEREEERLLELYRALGQCGRVQLVQFAVFLAGEE